MKVMVLTPYFIICTNPTPSQSPTAPPIIVKKLSGEKEGKNDSVTVTFSSMVISNLVTSGLLAEENLAPII